MVAMENARSPMQAETRSIVASRITPEDFAPFGRVISVEASTRLRRSLYGDKIESYNAGPFESDRPVEFIIVRLNIREFLVRFLERHSQLTQAFIPLDGHPFLVAVARPGAAEHRGVPVPEEIRAFFVPAHTGVVLHRDTWHEPPFPLTDGALSLVTNHRAITEGLSSELDERGELQKPDVDKRSVIERTGLAIQVKLP
jgi:ureidoglycolate lyase